MKIFTQFILGFIVCHLSAQVQLGNDIDGEGEFDRFGEVVSISADGNRLAIGAPNNSDNGFGAGHVRVFDWNGTDWVQQGQTITGVLEYDYFGSAVALAANGNRVVIGADGVDTNGTISGQAQIYEWDGTVWLQIGQTLNGAMTIDVFGSAVAISDNGNRVAIGAPGNAENGNYSGQVRVFDYNGTSWIQVGANINGENAWDESGTAIALSANGNRLAIGAPRNNGNGIESGHVRVFDWDGTSWIQAGQDIDGEADNDSSGFRIDLSDDGLRLAIGALSNDDNGTASGHIRVYEYNGNQWIKIGQDIDGNLGEWLGTSVAITANGNRVVAGATTGFDGGVNSPGLARIYDWDGVAWQQVGATIVGEAGEDYFGYAITISANGERIAVGAQRNSANGDQAGHVRVYDASPIILSDTEDITMNIISVYPNPVSDALKIVRKDNTPIHIYVYTIEGKLLLHSSYTNEYSIELPFKNIPSGCYVVHVNSQITSYQYKIIKH